MLSLHKISYTKRHTPLSFGVSDARLVSHVLLTCLTDYKNIILLVIFLSHAIDTNVQVYTTNNKVMNIQDRLNMD